jgi:hypothetical protein
MVSIALHDIIEKRFPNEKKSEERDDSINFMMNLANNYTSLENTLKS